MPDVQSEAAERERQLIEKVEQVRDLRNYVSSIGVIIEESAASSLNSAGGVEGPLMYWRQRPDGERESQAALIEGSGGGYNPVERLSIFTSSDDVLARAERCAGLGGEVAVIQS